MSAVVSSQKLWRTLDYVFVLRPVLMPPVWTVALLGYYQGRRGGGEAGPIGLVLLLSTALVGAIYLVNQLFDIESDRLNRKLFLIADGHISERAAAVEAVFLFLLSIVGAYLLTRDLGYLFLLSAILGIVYSVPPLAWKDRPWRGLIANMSGHGIFAFSFGWLTAAPLSLSMVTHALPYGLAIAAIFINTTLPDIEGDRRSGKLTLGVRLGVLRGSRLSAGFAVATVVASFLVEDWPLFVASVVAFPLFVLMIRGCGIPAVIRATKASILALSAAAGLIFPWYLPFLFVGYWGSRVYYRRRFAIEYPTVRAA